MLHLGFFVLFYSAYFIPQDVLSRHRCGKVCRKVLLSQGSVISLRHFCCSHTLGWPYLLVTMRVLPCGFCLFVCFWCTDHTFWYVLQKWAGSSKSILKFLRSFKPNKSSLLVSNLLHLRLDHCCFSRKFCELLCKQISLPHATSASTCNNPWFLPLLSCKLNSVV